MKSEEKNDNNLDVMGENQRLKEAIIEAVDILNSYHHVKALGKVCDLLTNALIPNASREA